MDLSALAFCFGCGTLAQMLPKGQHMKRCSRCRITTYCSTECQSAHWKLMHRNNCTPHSGLLASVDALNPKGLQLQEPAKGTEERRTLDMGMRFSKWMDSWRLVLSKHALVSLDLANHPERVTTHCTVVWTRLNHKPHKDKLRDFKVSHIQICVQQHIVDLMPEMAHWMGKTTPDGLPRMPFITVLDDSACTMPCTRVLQVNADPSFLEKFVGCDKGYSAIRAQFAEHNLRVAVDMLPPSLAEDIYSMYAFSKQIPVLQPEVKEK